MILLHWFHRYFFFLFQKQIFIIIRDVYFLPFDITTLNIKWEQKKKKF